MSYEFQPCLRCGKLMSVRAEDTWRDRNGKLYHYLTEASYREIRRIGRRLIYGEAGPKYVPFPTCLTCREAMDLIEKMDNVVNGGA